MARKDVSLISRLAKKNIKDTVFLGIAVIAIIAIIMINEEKSNMLMWEFVVLALYYIQYQFSKNELLNSLDKLIDNEFKEFQKISTKVLQLSEKQRQITNKYMDMLQGVVQSTKSFKSNSLQTNEKTQNLNNKIQETYEFSETELKSLNENINSMQNLKQKVQVIAELIIDLADYVKQIGSTVSIVENISEQTNMLALNAAVEAARAGEYGKGFSVVASEIRKLADESKQATSKITNLVAEIEQTTSSTLSATEEGAREIESEVKFSDEINTNFMSIVNNIKDLIFGLNDIINSSKDQQTITDEVLDVIENMQKGISESIMTVEENIENIRVFAEISTNIKDNIVD